MLKYFSIVIAIWVVWAGDVSSAPSMPPKTSPTYQTFSIPSAPEDTSPVSINASGEIAGTYDPIDNREQFGFERLPDGTIYQFTAFSSSQIEVVGISDKGTIYLNYDDKCAERSAKGRIDMIALSGGLSCSSLYGSSKNGWVVGATYSSQQNAYLIFVRSPEAVSVIAHPVACRG
jgi:hypothetical protein